MNRENLEKFFRFLLESREHQDKVKSFSGDFNALSAYAREHGFDISPEELREHREKSLAMYKGRVEEKMTPAPSSGPGVQAFLALMTLGDTDEEVAARLEELSVGDMEGMIAYGAEKGFVFDKQDMLAVGKDILQPSEELSDEELEMVAGGTTLLAAAVVGGVVAAFLFATFLVTGGSAALVVGFVWAMTAAKAVD